MDNYRNNPPEMINNIPVVKILDYQISKAKNLKTNSIDSIDLPKSNVLQFILEDNTKITIRPSGTEPKIKYYFAIVKRIQIMSLLSKCGQNCYQKWKSSKLLLRFK